LPAGKYMPLVGTLELLGTKALPVMVVPVTAATDAPPMIAPSIVPPLMSIVVTAPRFDHVAVAAVGDPVMVGEVRLLPVRVCEPPTVTTDAVSVPAFVTRQSPVPTVITPLECVASQLPLAMLNVKPEAPCRSAQPRDVVPSAARSLETGLNAVACSVSARLVEVA
jgi:hypothetical protein